MLATLTVNTDRDDFAADSDDGLLTLREAIRVVNLQYTPGPSTSAPGEDRDQISGTPGLPGVIDEIVFAPGLFNGMGKAKISLANFVGGSSVSALAINRDVVIEAPEGKEVEVSAGAGVNYSQAA
jgi:hypothetical protein